MSHLSYRQCGNTQKKVPLQIQWEIHKKESFGWCFKFLIRKYSWTILRVRLINVYKPTPAKAKPNSVTRVIRNSNSSRSEYETTFRCPWNVAQNQNYRIFGVIRFCLRDSCDSLLAVAEPSWLFILCHSIEQLTSLSL